MKKENLVADLTQRDKRNAKARVLLDDADRNKIKFCCDYLKKHVSIICIQHAYECPDKLINIAINMGSGKPSWYGNSPNATYSVSHCPWCGQNLPSLANLLPREVKSNTLSQLVDSVVGKPKSKTTPLPKKIKQWYSQA